MNLLNALSIINLISIMMLFIIIINNLFLYTFLDCIYKFFKNFI